MARKGKEVRGLFAIPDDVIYLNAASRSPLLKSACQIGQEAMEKKLLPWTIGGNDQDAEDARALFGKLIRAPQGDVALAPSCSYAISVAARNLELQGRIQNSTKILVLEGEYSSNTYPWQDVCKRTKAKLEAVMRPTDANWTRAILEHPGWKDVSCVAIPNVHWCDGSAVDLATIGKFCRDTRKALVIDGTQSIGAVPFNIEQVDADFVVCGVHKWLFGPFGLAFLYASPAYHKSGVPIEFHEHNRYGADADTCLPFINRDDFVGYEERFKSGARRFDSGGRPNPILLPMINEGLKQVLDWSPEWIQKSISSMTQQICQHAEAIGLQTTFRASAGHMVGICRDIANPTSHHDFADQLSKFLRAHNIHTSSRFGFVRVAPHVYCSPRDIEATKKALTEFVVQHPLAKL
eukprot:c12446_g2_i4.p1 GENE.c12446_g2_i4~~c12446_g2_i4.p1  ORF type:complete len:419 (+),score=81.28 c12446_g2_i4:37-1257(+)